uniref:Cytochrome c n=1 Tax=Ignavibacterium album TaxID=591197 RepID=A0A832DI44_9BACT
MKNIIAYLSIIIAIVALYGFAFTISSNDDPAGKKIFIDNKCNMCHTVKSAGIESKKSDATDLSNAGAEMKAEDMIKYLKKEMKLNNKDHKTAFKGSDEDLKKLVEWLSTLKAESK